MTDCVGSGVAKNGSIETEDEAYGHIPPPIEKPAGLMMVYAMTRRQVGKVLTPLKVFKREGAIKEGEEK